MSAAEPRNVTAVCWFKGGPGREREAAEAWAFELTYYFARGVGEQPKVSYDETTMLYECSGLMTTTHPLDKSPVTEFTFISEPWDLDFSSSSERRKTVRELHAMRSRWWDGRGHGEVAS